jgi:hypothetical protein
MGTYRNKQTVCAANFRAVFKPCFCLNFNIRFMRLRPDSGLIATITADLWFVLGTQIIEQENLVRFFSLKPLIYVK